MGAVAAGLIAGSALKLLLACGCTRWASLLVLVLASIAFVGVVWLHLALHLIVLGLGGLALRPDLVVVAAEKQVMSLSDWIQLLLFHLSLSLLAVGGAITLAPDLHRWLVNEHGWLTEAQFNQSIALAQAAPGPNVLFIATGWTVGLTPQVRIPIHGLPPCWPA